MIGKCSRRTGYLTVVEKAVRSTIKEMAYPRLLINTEKTVRATTKFRRTVTGLTLANDGRVTIGKRRKRQLHAAVFNAGKGKVEPERLQRLAGHLAFVNSVEPEFLNVLRRRYSDELVTRIMKFVVFQRLGTDQPH